VRDRQKKKEKQNICFSRHLAQLRNEASSNRGAQKTIEFWTSKDDITSPHVTSRHDNVNYGNDVPDDIKVDNVLGQENPQPDTGPGGSNSKSKSQKQDQIIIKRQTEIKKNNKVHLKWQCLIIFFRNNQKTKNILTQELLFSKESHYKE
jgi:hypothetical protein